MSSWHRQGDFPKWRWHTCEPLLFKERSASFLHKGLHSGPFWIIPKITSRKRFFQGYLFKFCLLWTTAATATKTSLKKWICATSNFIKSCQQVWGRVNQPFILFIHHIWGETVPWGAVFIIQTSDRMQYFTILQYKLHSLPGLTQDSGRSKHACAFTKKNSKITYIYGEPVLTFVKRQSRLFKSRLIELYASTW